MKPLRFTCSGTGRNRNGIAMVYALVSMTVLAGFVSLAVDYGAAQLVKTQLQSATDATAHDYIELYNTNSKSYANTNGPASYATTTNGVTLMTGKTATYAVTWGYWNFSTKAWSTSNNGGNIAVKVDASFTKANNNAVPLLFGSIFGNGYVNVHSTTIAASVSNSTVTMPISAQSNPYLAGMPAGSTSANGDDTTDNGATEVTGIPVKAGDVLTFINPSGTSSVAPPSMPYADAEGVQTGSYGTATHHGVSWDGTGSAHTENGIADAIMPEDSLMGLFLDDNAPDSTAAPTTVVDWTSSSNKNKATYTNLKLKQPFYIGNGATTSSTVQQFTVPTGATRLFLGLWDGIQYNNNDGSLTVTITREVKSVQIVK